MKNKVTFETKVNVCISDMLKTRKTDVGFEVLIVEAIQCSVSIYYLFKLQMGFYPVAVVLQLDATHK
jgi:hypothetical protein